MRWSRVVSAMVLCGIAAGGCRQGDEGAKGAGGTDMSYATTAPEGVAEGAPTPPPAGFSKDMAGADRMRAVQQAAGPGQSPTVLPGSLPVDASAPMIIRTGSATIEVDSLEPAIAQLRQIATQLGGFVGNTMVQGGRDQVRSATVEIKVPAQRWTQLLEGLKPIGKLESQQESAEDVGEEYTDVSARVSNARRLEDRLVALLANRTGKLEEVLAVERELARVREEIERYEGRLRYLRSRAAVSTMTVNVHEPHPLLGSRPGTNPIADAFRSAWRNFVAFVAFLISALGVLVPLGLLALAGWWGWRKWKGGRSDAQTSSLTNTGK